jgi:hypothetical protein
MERYPTTGRQRRKYRAIKPATGTHIDILNRCLLTEPCASKPRGHGAIVLFDALSINEKSKPFLEGKPLPFRRLLLLFECADHAEKTQPFQ